jgi:hypothetical protein
LWAKLSAVGNRREFISSVEVDSGKCRKEIFMTSSIALNTSRPNNTGARPSVTSFDSGYEHSFDHYVDVRLLVEDADREASNVPETAVAS